MEEVCWGIGRVYEVSVGKCGGVGGGMGKCVGRCGKVCGGVRRGVEKCVGVWGEVRRVWKSVWEVRGSVLGFEERCREKCAGGVE